MTSSRSAPTHWFWSHDIQQTNINGILTAGTRLVRLSNYRTEGRQRLAALLYTEPGPATHYIFNLPTASVIESIKSTQRPLSITVDSYSGLPEFSLVVEDTDTPKSMLKMDLDEAGLKTLANEKQCITDLAIYSVNGKRLFAAIFEPRSNPSWLLLGVTDVELSKQLRKLKAALIWIRSYQEDGKQLYAACAQPAETGITTWWFTDLNADEVARKLEINNAYPIDLNAMDYNDRLRFTVVMRRHVAGRK